MSTISGTVRRIAVWLAVAAVAVACGEAPPATEGGRPAATSTTLPDGPTPDGSAPEGSARDASVHVHEDGEHHHHDDARPSPGDEVVLSRDGLGVVLFGERAEPAMERLRAELGEPAVVTRWMPASGGPMRPPWGVCPGPAVQGAKWGDLWVLFARSSEINGREAHVFSWVLGPSAGHDQAGTGLRTTESVGVGSTVAELRAAYGELLILDGSPEGGGAKFRVDVRPGESGWPLTLGGFVTGTQDDDTVTSLRGGRPCGE